jgi:hypothetical protein
MVFADPPYNVAIEGHVSGLGKNHREFVQASGEMSNEAVFECRTILTATGGRRCGHRSLVS